MILPILQNLVHSEQIKPGEDTASETALVSVNQVPENQTTTPVSDDYFQTIVITSLLAILKDQALSTHHHTVIEAIMSIFKTQGLKCVTFLPQVLSLSADNRSMADVS